jgi:hypothetical protein
MRQQYHFRPTKKGVLIWDVHRLVELTKDLPIIEIPVCEIRELDETFWFDGNNDLPTCRRIALHAKLINETDLAYPIILSQDGHVMDGMHRVCKALIEGRKTILAVRFDVDPEHNYMDVSPDDLPY